MVKRTCILAILVLYVCLLSSCAQTSTSEPTWQEQYDLGIRYLSEGNYEEAIIAFTAAIEIDPKQALAYVGRGDAYMGSGEAEENLTAALSDYEKAIELNDTLAEAYLGLADVYIRRGDYERAKEILQIALEKNGDNQIIKGKIESIPKVVNLDSEKSQMARLLQEGDNGNMLTFDEFSFYGADWKGLSDNAAEEILHQIGLVTMREIHDDSISGAKRIDSNRMAVGPYVDISHENGYVTGWFYADAWREEDQQPLDTGIRNICIGDSLETVLSKLGFTTAADMAKIANEFYAQEFEKREDLKNGIDGWGYSNYSINSESSDEYGYMRIEFDEPLITGGNFLDNGHLKVDEVSFLLYLKMYESEEDGIYLSFTFAFDRLKMLIVIL